MKTKRSWTKEEEEYLSDKWGMLSVKTIAKNLNRTEDAIIVRKTRLGLGAFLDSGDFVTWNQLLLALGLGLSGSSYKMKSWVENRGFPIHTKRVKSGSFKIVYLDDFWKWAEQNQSFLDFSNFEPYVLGAEPDWVAAKRRQDCLAKRQYKKTPWTKIEDEKLIRYVKQQRYGYRELSRMLGRTEGAIQRRLISLGIKDRPIKANNRIKWTDEEYEILGKMIAAGKTYEQMAEVIGRSVKAIRGRVYDMYRTEVLDKVRSIINGRPELNLTGCGRRKKES